MPSSWSSAGILDRLLFVTSEAALEYHQAANWVDLIMRFTPATPEQATAIVGSRLVRLPQGIANARRAAVQVRPYLPRRDGIEGVVIIGNHDLVPMQRVLSVPLAWLEPLGKAHGGNDSDLWWVWSDDIYGDKTGNGIANLPVSRMPIQPRKSRKLSGTNRDGSGIEGVCIRAGEFGFAQSVYPRIVSEEGDSWVSFESPPYAQDGPHRPEIHWDEERLVPENLTADRLYLVVHGEANQLMTFRGTSQSGWYVVAFDREILEAEWLARGVAFAGVCYGVYTIDKTARRAVPGEPLSLVDASDSLALTMLQRGGQAFVGFTTRHSMPDVTDYAPLGAPLHELFWCNHVARGWPPSRALYRAKSQFIASSLARNQELVLDDPDRSLLVLIARDMKSYWAASCLGLGW
jgi:hypothetical protein